MERAIKSASEFALGRQREINRLLCPELQGQMQPVQPSASFLLCQSCVGVCLLACLLFFLHVFILL